MTEGMGVSATAVAVKESLNICDDVHICDCKGLPISDSSETESK